MQQSNIKTKYNFNQLIEGLIGFVGNIELKLQEIYPELPVYILDTGDQSYLMSEKFKKYLKKQDEIYQKTPRFVIKPLVEGIQFKTEEDTNKYNNFVYNFENENYIASVARKCCILQCDCFFVSPNVVYALQNFEIFATISTYSNVFTYNVMGSTLEAAYAISSNSGERPGMDMSSGTRNYSYNFSIDLQLHILVPKVSTIKKLTDKEFNEIRLKLIEYNDDKSISSQQGISTNND